MDLARSKRLLRTGVLSAVLLGAVTHLHAAESVPRFKDYRADTYEGPRADSIQLGLSAQAIPVDELRASLGKPVDFAGRYVWVIWPSVDDCTGGAALDVRTGQVHPLPFAACAYSDYDLPYEVRPYSRLVVVAGKRGGSGPVGAHFYEFDGTAFNYLATRLPNGEIVRREFELPDDPTVYDEPKVSAEIEPAAGDQPAGQDKFACMVMTFWMERSLEPDPAVSREAYIKNECEKLLGTAMDGAEIATFTMTMDTQDPQFLTKTYGEDGMALMKKVTKETMKVIKGINTKLDAEAPYPNQP